MATWNSKNVQGLCFQIIHKSVVRLEEVPQTPTARLINLIWWNVEIKTGIYARVRQKDDFAYEFRRKVSPY